MYQYRATLIRVVDGDTLDLLVDQGLDTFRKLRLRLNGLNAPEKATAEGKLVKAYVVAWFASLGVDTFIVNTFKDRTEKYGRYLAEVFPANASLSGPDKGKASLNATLLATGRAKAYDGTGPR